MQVAVGTVTGSVFLVDLTARALAATVTTHGCPVQCLAWRKLPVPKSQGLPPGSPKAPATPSLSPGPQARSLHHSEPCSK